MPRHEKLNPHRTTVHGGKLNPKAVAHYEQSPGSRYHGSGGEVIAQRDHNGNVHIVNGKHRRAAAINTGRKIEAKVYGPDETLPQYESGGCLPTLLVLLAGASGLSWAAVELASRVVGA